MAVPVKIVVTTGNNMSEGSDITLLFNPKILQASGSAFRKGSMYKDYMPAIIDNNKGVIQVSGLASLNKVVGEAGVFGTINFKAIKAGNTTVKIEFRKGSTRETNVVQAKTGKDILRKTSNLSLHIL